MRYLFASLIIISSFAFAGLLVAQTIDVSFPVPELGNCESKEACRTYCNDPANMDACTAFAEMHGLIDREGAARAKRFKERLVAGEGPGGCKTPLECRQFCADEANVSICSRFAEEHKLGTPLPGGCDSKASCAAYCDDEAHHEECFAFGKARGFISDDDRRTIEEGVGQIRREFEHAPLPVRECVLTKLGPDGIRDIEFGTRIPSREIARGIHGCFEQFRDLRGNGISTDRRATTTAPIIPSAIPDRVLRCVKQVLPDSDVRALMNGEATSVVRERLQECFRALEREQNASGTAPFPEERRTPLNAAKPLPRVDARPIVPPSLPHDAVPPSTEKVCDSLESCAKVCTDPNGQFYYYPLCNAYRDEVLQFIPPLGEGEIPPSMENLPSDNACPDLVTCAARCGSEASAYFLKSECVEYRENNPPAGARSGNRMFFANILNIFTSLFR